MAAVVELDDISPEVESGEAEMQVSTEGEAAELGMEVSMEGESAEVGMEISVKGQSVEESVEAGMQVSANTAGVDTERSKLAVVARKQEKQDDAINMISVEVMNGDLVGGPAKVYMYRAGARQGQDIGYVNIGFGDIWTLRKKVWVRKGGGISLESVFS